MQNANTAFPPHPSLLRCHEVHMSIKCSPTYLHKIVIITTTTDKGFTKDDVDDVFYCENWKVMGLLSTTVSSTAAVAGRAPKHEEGLFVNPGRDFRLSVAVRPF